MTTLAIILTIVYSLSLIRSLAMILITRSQLKKKVSNLPTGIWAAGSFFMQPPLPLNLDTNDIQVIKLEEKHNHFVKYFWLSQCLLIAAVIMFNIAEGN